MKVLELFSGTRSIGRAFEKRGHDVFSVDYDERFVANVHEDIEYLTPEMVLEMFGRPDVIWASPDCTTFSIAGISHHRTKNQNTGQLDAKSEYALKCDRVDLQTVRLIRDLRPTYWFIENPRGGLRKMDWMQWAPRYTVTYCQYGDTRMKPTDIFTNHPHPMFKPPCKNGDPCHESAPRGAKTGTQGLATVDRSRIPQELCEHIVKLCEQALTEPTIL